MINLFIYVFILAILNSVLFYGKELGINVILFIIPILIFMYYVLKSNKKINNKKGLLFILPIILLSLSYLIYDNITFKLLNGMVIILLFILMFIYTVYPTYNLGNLFKRGILLILEPFECIGNVYRLLGNKLSEVLKISDSKKKKIKSIILIIPIIILILILLTSADIEFNNIFKYFFKLFRYLSLDNIIGRIIVIGIFFTYVSAFINYLVFKYKDDHNTNTSFKVDGYTIRLLLIILNIVYIVFDFIQIKSLVFHKLPIGITYATYARQGFFQLMFISLINIVIILLSKHNKDDKYNTSIKYLSTIMILLTTIIIYSSFFRMSMYESAYGYTILRLLVYVTLATEVILLIPTFRYIFNSKVNILKHYLIVITIVYTILGIFPVDYFIANKNINRYYKTGKIDIEYLENYNSDNIPLLKELYDKTDDEELKYNISNYFYLFKEIKKIDGFQEYNISTKKALDIINK